MSWDVNKPKQLTHADTDRCAGSGQPPIGSRCAVCGQEVKLRAHGGAALHRKPGWLMAKERDQVQA